MKTTMLSAAMAAILITSSMTNPVMAMDPPHVLSNTMGQGKKMIPSQETISYMKDLLTHVETHATNLLNLPKEELDAKKTSMQTIFSDTIKDAHFLLPQEIIDRIQAISKTFDLYLPPIKLLTSEYVIEVEQDAILTRLEEDYEKFKDTVRAMLSTLKGKALTPEQNKKAFHFATDLRLNTEASMFGDQKDTNPFQAHNVPSEVMGLIAKHAKAEDRHALNKALLVDKQMHKGAQSIPKDKIESSRRTLDNAMNFFNEAMMDRIFGTEDGTVPLTMTRKEAQEILQSKIVQDTNNALQFFQQNPHILSYPEQTDDANFLESTLKQLDFIANP